MSNIGILLLYMKKIFKSRWFHTLLQIVLQIVNKKYSLDIPPEILALPTALYVAGKTVTDCSENKNKTYPV